MAKKLYPKKPLPATNTVPLPPETRKRCLYCGLTWVSKQRGSVLCPECEEHSGAVLHSPPNSLPGASGRLLLSIPIPYDSLGRLEKLSSLDLIALRQIATRISTRIIAEFFADKIGEICQKHPSKQPPDKI